MHRFIAPLSALLLCVLLFFHCCSTKIEKYNCYLNAINEAAIQLGLFYLTIIEE